MNWINSFSFRIPRRLSKTINSTVAAIHSMSCYLISTHRLPESINASKCEKLFCFLVKFPHQIMTYVPTKNQNFIPFSSLNYNENTSDADCAVWTHTKCTLARVHRPSVIQLMFRFNFSSAVYCMCQKQTIGRMFVELHSPSTSIPSTRTTVWKRF